MVEMFLPYRRWKRIMTKDQLDTALRVAKNELEKLTNETLRPNQGFKMRTNGPIISSIITAIRYYENELEKSKKLSLKKKED